jgi:PhnB protein
MTTATISTYHTVTPCLVVPDADRELRFLVDALGGRERDCTRRPDGTIMHAEIVVGDSIVMLSHHSDAYPAHRQSLYLWVADVDATYARALQHGATSDAVPEDKPYGHRNAGVTDPGGITWWIGAPVRKG